MNVGLPSIDTILHNAAASFMQVCNSETASSVAALAMGLRGSSPPPQILLKPPPQIFV